MAVSNSSKVQGLETGGARRWAVVAACVLVLLFVACRRGPQALKPSGPIVQIPPLISYLGGTEPSHAQPPKKVPHEKVNEAVAKAHQNPNDARIQNDAGCLVNAAGDREQALKLFERGMQLDPRDPVIIYNLARIQYELGRLDEALQNLRKALGLRPEFVEARVFLVSIYVTKKDYDAAESILSKMLGEYPERVDALIVHGVILTERGKLDEAILIFERVRGIDPNNAIALYDLGVAYQNRDNLARAEQFYREAVEKDPELAEAYNNLGIVLALIGKLAESFEVIHKAVEQKSYNSVFVANLAGTMEIDKKSEDTIAGEWFSEGGSGRLSGTIQGEYGSIDLPMPPGSVIKISKVSDGVYRWDETGMGSDISTTVRRQSNGSYQGPTALPPGFQLPAGVSDSGTVTFWMRGDVLFGDTEGTTTGEGVSLQMARHWKARRKK